MVDFSNGYADAVVALAKAEGSLEYVETELLTVARAVESNNELRNILTDPNKPVGMRLGLVETQVLSAAHPTTRAAMAMIIAAGRAGDLTSIATKVAEVASASRNRELAEVYVAKPITDEQREALRRALEHSTGKNLDQYMGRAFIGDGVATMVSGAAGGTGVTTYAENIGVMAATRIYSTAVFFVAALLAVLLGFSPKFGALIQAIPLPVMGGVSIVVFGLIAVAGAKIWVDNKVDFSDTKNLIVAAITLILGTGEFTLKFGEFALGGIGTATFGAIILYALLSAKRSD